MLPEQWRRNPKPDIAVTALSDAASDAAHNGQVRLIAIVTVDPMLKVECEVAGDLDQVKTDLLIGGLTRLIQRISK